MIFAFLIQEAAGQRSLGEGSMSQQSAPVLDSKQTNPFVWGKNISAPPLRALGKNCTLLTYRDNIYNFTN
jgi:hypothetical protein